MALSKILENSITDGVVSSAKLKDFAAAVDLNGVELILDADQDTSITADTDDRIDFKLGGVEHISLNNSSGDTVIKPMVDAKDIIFQQYDGNKILEINDGNYVGIGGNAAGAGEIRIYEDTDDGTHYTGFKAGNNTESIAYTLPTADAASSGQALVSNASGVLSWATVSANTPTSADGQALGSASLEWSDLFLADSSTIQFGNDQDTILTHTDGAGLTLNSTNKLMFNDASQYIQGASATVLDIAATDEIELTATLIEVVGNATVSGTLGVTGVLTGTSLDISGNIDIDGTTNLDAVDIDGAVQLDATLTVGANDQGYDVILYGDTASANMTWDTSVDDLIFNGAARIVVPDGQLVLGSTAVTSTAAELNLLDGVSGLVQADLTKLAAVDSTAAELNIVDGGTSATSTTVVDADRVVMNDNGTMVQVAVTDLAAYFDDEITAMPNLVTTAATTVGALNSGSITSGFGTIDTGSSNITTTGVGTFGSLNISGNIDIDGTTNLDTVDIDGPVQLDSTLTIGANDQGYDVILYGDTASANMTWDTSVDDLIFNGAARIVVPDGQLVLGSTAVTSTAAELNLLDGVSGLVQADLTKLAAVDATAAELNIMDGGTSATSTTIADADRFVLNDNGTMVQVAGSDVKTYIGGVSTLAGLTDVSMDISGLTNGLIIQTESDGSAPNTGTLNNASGILGIGENVFNALTSGDDSLALGNNALATMTTGSANIAIGNNTNDQCTTENYNIAIGYNAMTADVNGAEFNVAIGSGALNSLTTGDSNVAIGHNAALSQTTAGANVIIGSDAGRDLTEGTDCTLIGYDAGYHGNATTTGTSITILGAKSHASGATNVRQIVLGYNVTGAANDSLTFGDASTDCRINFGQTSITAPSDIRMKENIETATAGLDFINDLRPVTYNWKQEKDIPVELNAHVEGSTKRYNNDKLNHGFIAQEVKEVIDNHPEIKDGFNMWNEDDADGRQRIGETALVPVLVTAMQEMSAKIDTLQNEINNLKGE